VTFETARMEDLKTLGDSNLLLQLLLSTSFKTFSPSLIFEDKAETYISGFNETARIM